MTLEKNNLTIKIFKNILDNLNDKWYMIMKHEKTLDLFNENEEWERISYQWTLILYKIILFRNVIDIYWVMNVRVWL